MSPRLPTELFQIIIDHLHNDKRTLEQCTYVSQSWLAASRYHLISSIRISPKTYSTLLGLLSSPHSTLATSVSALIFTMWDLVARPPSAEDNEPADFNDIIDYFSSVKALTFLGIAFSDLDKLQTTNSDILKLDLSCCLFPSSLQLIHVISLFPSLNTLRCTVCKLLDSLATDALLFEPPRTLKTLQLDEQSLLVLIPDGQQQHSNLENIEILDISFGNSTVAELLRNAGSTLRRLRIEYNHTIRSSAALGIFIH